MKRTKAEEVGTNYSPAPSPFIAQILRTKQKRVGQGPLSAIQNGDSFPLFDSASFTGVLPSAPQQQKPQRQPPANQSSLLDDWGMEDVDFPVVWTKEMDEVLREGALRYPGEWEEVRKHMLPHNITVAECEKRWELTRNEPIKGPWSPEEDALLRHLIMLHGSQKWSNISREFPGRTGKQCRERWLNHLDVKVKKSSWTDKEDEILIAAQQRLGNRWSDISKLLPGRAENAVKNRYNSIITKRLSLFGPDVGQNIFAEERRQIGGEKGGLSSGGPENGIDAEGWGDDTGDSECTSADDEEGCYPEDLDPIDLTRSICTSLGRASPSHTSLPPFAANSEATNITRLALDPDSFDFLPSAGDDDSQGMSARLIYDPHVVLGVVYDMLSTEQLRYKMLASLELTAVDFNSGISNHLGRPGIQRLRELHHPHWHIDGPPRPVRHRNRNIADGKHQADRTSNRAPPSRPPMDPKSPSPFAPPIPRSQSENLIPPPLDIGSPEIDFERTFGIEDVVHKAANAADLQLDEEGNALLKTPVPPVPSFSDRRTYSKETHMEAALRMSLNSLSLQDEDWNFLAEADGLGSRTPIPAHRRNSLKQGMLGPWGPKSHATKLLMMEPAPLSTLSPMAKYLQAIDEIPDEVQRRSQKSRLVDAFMACA